MDPTWESVLSWLKNQGGQSGNNPFSGGSFGSNNPFLNGGNHFWKNNPWSSGGGNQEGNSQGQNNTNSMTSPSSDMAMTGSPPTPLGQLFPQDSTAPPTPANNQTPSLGGDTSLGKSPAISERLNPNNFYR